MNRERIELISLRIERAEEALQDAKKLLASGSNRGAVNRFYYAVFYAARAVLALKKLDSPKHSGVISLFNKEFIKTGELPKECGRIIGNIFNRRIEGDYSDLKTFSNEEVNDIAKGSERFVSITKHYLRQYIKEVVGNHVEIKPAPDLIKKLHGVLKERPSMTEALVEEHRQEVKRDEKLSS